MILGGLLEQLKLIGLLEFLNLEISALDLMPVLCLLADHLRQLLRKFVLLLPQPLHFLFVLDLHRRNLIPQVFVLIAKCLVFAFYPRGLVLALLLIHLKFVPFLASLLPELQIRHTLSHHMVHTGDGLLNVFRPPAEQIT